MHRQGLGLKVLHQAEDRADEADHQAQVHQRGAVHAAQPVKLHLGQIGNVDVGFTGKNARRKGKDRGWDSRPKELVSF